MIRIGFRVLGVPVMGINLRGTRLEVPMIRINLSGTSLGVPIMGIYLRGASWGVPIIRIIVPWVLYVGSPILEKQVSIKEGHMGIRFL